jgi:NAD(P) transhydrogenase subunit alpha
MTHVPKGIADLHRRSVPSAGPCLARRPARISPCLVAGCLLGVMASVWAADVLVTPADLPAGAAAGETTKEYISTLFVFMLATFVGLDVIRRVSRLLHTTLMSLTNAISAIAVVGSLLVAGRDHPTPINVLGLIAVIASVINIVSGFLITDRMLKMFKKREGAKHE